MRSTRLSRIALLPAAFFFLSPSPASAQKPITIEQFGKRIQKEIKRRKLHVVVLLDLSNAEGRFTERTQPVTAELSDFLSANSGNIKVLRAGFRVAAAQGALSAADPGTLQQLSAFCAQNKCDALLHGTVQDGPSGKTVSISIVDPQTMKALAEISALLRPDAGNPLYWVDPHFSEPPPYAAPGKDGVSMPRCYYQPNPLYSEAARMNHVQGNVTMGVVISREGKIVKIAVLNRLGFGLDRVALETVRTWKCNPALDRNGNPVPVETTVEVGFHLLL
jgi:TonB family protein